MKTIANIVNINATLNRFNTTAASQPFDEMDLRCSLDMLNRR